MAAKEVGDTTPTKCIAYAADGDVILVVGPEEKKFQVHSIVLGTASTVFRAMFGPHFSEGQWTSED
jgi:BTB/POZ domain